MIYHCPNGNGRFSAIEVGEFRRLFVSRIFSTEDLTSDRTRRGLRFCT
jgi:hypothetical protein